MRLSMKWKPKNMTREIATLNLKKKELLDKIAELDKQIKSL